jgi:cell division protease FtsH
LFLPIAVQTVKEYSEDSARLIDAEVKRILTEAHEKVKAILATHRAALEELAQLLLKKEVVERAELQAILKVVDIGEAREKKKSGALTESNQAASAPSDRSNS